MNGVPIIGEGKKEEVKDILKIEEELIAALDARNAFISACPPRELYERQAELRREENNMMIRVMIDVVKYLAEQRRAKQIVTLTH